MSRAAGSIALQLLVKPEHRTDQGIQRVRNALESAGLRVTAVGRATASARISAGTFEQTFGQAVPSTAADAGPSQSDETDLPVPPALQPYVQSITVAPKALLMDESDSTDSAS